MLSALFYKPANMGKRLLRLLIPFLVFYIIAFGIYTLKAFIKHDVIDWLYFLNPFLGVTDKFENTPVWFLLSLAEISLMTYILVKLLTGRCLIFVSWLIGLAGYLLGHYQITNAYFVGTSLTVLPFFITAWHFKSIIMKQFPCWVYILCLVVAYLLFLANPLWCNLSQNYLPVGVVIFVSVSALASYGLMGISQYIDMNKLCSVILCYLGRNSLIILCTHFYIIGISYTLQTIIPNLWLSTIVSLIIIMIIEIPIIEFINRKAKWMTGIIS